VGQAGRLKWSIGPDALPEWARWGAFVLVALLGLAIRLPQLGARPMHTDEAINAFIVGQLLAGKAFIYDPQDRHGPVLAALALPLVRITGCKGHFLTLRSRSCA
jgi:predicted membrane-bound mannosyltransferase